MFSLDLARIAFLIKKAHVIVNKSKFDGRNRLLTNDSEARPPVAGLQWRDEPGMSAGGECNFRCGQVWKNFYQIWDI